MSNAMRNLIITAVIYTAFCIACVVKGIAPSLFECIVLSAVIFTGLVVMDIYDELKKEDDVEDSNESN